MTSLLQFEVDKKRLRGFANFADSQFNGFRTPTQYIYKLASGALLDTFNNGGTFVMVVSEDKITIVQRKEAESLDEEKAP
jgi:hypothetical protein